MIEAAPERLEVKRATFAELATACAPDALLATNTVVAPVAAMAQDIRNPERVCGMHFFNPPPLMRLVEIVAAASTAETTVETATEVARQMNREPIRTADSPGFIVNRCNRPFTLEALQILGDGKAGVAEIDAAMREVGGYRMGPFELIDLIGVDVNLEVARSFYAQRAEPRWKPHPIQERMVADGKLGRKRGTGFYSYGPSNDAVPLAPSAPLAPQDIVDRIVAQLINEASFAVAEGVGSREDIDLAMRLGLNHPRGPFEWLADLGAERVVATLDELARDLGGERYLVAPALRSEV